MRICGSVGGILLLCAWAPTASAIPLALVWDAPENCSSAVAIEARVNAALGQGHAGNTRKVKATSTVRRRADAYLLEFSIVADGNYAERSLTVTDCKAAETATALLILLSVAPTRTARLADEAPGDAAAVTEVVNPEPKPVRPSTNRTLDSGRSNGSSLSLEGVARLSASWRGNTDLTGVGYELFLGGKYGAFTLEFAGFWRPLFNSGIPTVADGDVAIRVVGGGIWSSLNYPLGDKLYVSPYVGIVFYSGQGTTRGIDQPGTGTASWVSASAGLRGTWHFHESFFLWLATGADVPFRRPRFVVDGIGEVFRPAPVAVRGALGLGFRFGPQSSATAAIE